MLLKSLRFKILYLICFVAAGIIAAYRLPAYASRMPWVILLIISDMYLFYPISKTDSQLLPLIRKILLTFTILPSVLLICFFLTLAFLSPVEWNPAVRTYLLGFAVLLYTIRIFPLGVFLFHDLRRLFFQTIFQRKINLCRIQRPIAISLIFSMVVSVFYFLGMIFWVYDYQVVEKQIQIQGLPEAYDGFRIVQVSDIHLGRWHSKEPLQRAITIVNSLEPDLIVFTGDLVNYSTEEALPFRNELSTLQAKHGIYAVLGNHDYGDYVRWPDPVKKEANIVDLHELFKDLGWVLLDNKHLILNHAGAALVLAGVGNYSLNSHYPNRARLDEAFAGVPDSSIRILLSHDPRITNDPTFTSNKVDLILSGHTHAMQLGIRVGGIEFSPASLVYEQWGGLYAVQVSDRYWVQIYVNRGLGHIGFPARIGIKPEISLLTLRPAE